MKRLATGHPTEARSYMLPGLRRADYRGKPQVIPGARATALRAHWRYLADLARAAAFTPEEKKRLAAEAHERTYGAS